MILDFKIYINECVANQLGPDPRYRIDGGSISINLDALCISHSYSPGREISKICTIVTHCNCKSFIFRHCSRGRRWLQVSAPCLLRKSKSRPFGPWLVLFMILISQNDSSGNSLDHHDKRKTFRNGIVTGYSSSPCSPVPRSLYGTLLATMDAW
jgi:hypothetical protein